MPSGYTVPLFSSLFRSTGEKTEVPKIKASARGSEWQNQDLNARRSDAKAQDSVQRRLRQAGI